MTYDTSIPTVKEELDRKSMDLLIRTSMQLENGSIDRRTAYIVNSTVWTLTAGLIDQDILDLAGKQADEIGPCPYRRIFSGPKFLVLWITTGKGYILQAVSGKTSKILRSRELDPGDLEQEIEALTKKLLASGEYAEI